MSFDVFFQTCNVSDKTEDAIDPFTGEKIKQPAGESITDDERTALKKILSAAGASNPNEHGYYLPKLSDGSTVEVFFDGLADDPDFGGGMIALRGSSPELTSFLYSLAQSGNLAISPAMEGDFTIVTSAEIAQRVSRRWPNATVVDSPNELHIILTKGMDGWKKYRDRVVGDS